MTTPLQRLLRRSDPDPPRTLEYWIRIRCLSGEDQRELDERMRREGRCVELLTELPPPP